MSKKPIESVEPKQVHEITKGEWKISNESGRKMRKSRKVKKL